MPDWKLSETSDQRFPHLSSGYGYCALLLMLTGGAGLPILNVYHRVYCPIRLDQILFLFQADGSPAAYATWAYVSDTTLAGLADGTQTSLHMSEWNEGTNLVIMDLVARQGMAQNIASRLKRKFPRGSNALYAFRRDRRNGRPLQRLRAQ